MAALHANLSGEAPRLMTEEEFLALPDDGVERWLINGVVREFGVPREKGQPMTVRNEEHSGIMANVTYFLELWRRSQPEPRGRVRCGEAGVKLSFDPETTLGVDVVYVSAEVANRQPRRTRLIDGVPILVVEILSPNDVIEAIEEKIESYRSAGVPLIWIINPFNRTVTIRRTGAGPTMVNDAETLTGDPHLPGFRVAVAELFE